MEGYYNFTEEDAFSFANHMRASTKRIGDELTFRKCPVCRSEKDKYTFSISLKTGQCECKRSSCGYRGNMITLSKDFAFSLSDDVDRYYNINQRNDMFRKFKDFTANHKPKVVQYMQQRGISEDTVKKYELTSCADNESTLVFPFRDQNNNLRFIKYRNMEFQKGSSFGSKEWCEKQCMPILFGMNHCSADDNSDLVITEGQIDSLSVVEAGVTNAVSVPTGANGFTWIPHCWEWMQQFKEIIVFGDCENDQVTLATEISKRFKNTKIVRIDDYQGCKDANEILNKFGKAAIVNAINNAEYPKLKGLIDMSEVKAVDLKKINKIKTQSNLLNEILGGGLYEGQVILQSGERGNGKSTWVSSIIPEAVTQGYNTLIYSGELENFFVRNWLDRQVIGKDKKDITDTETDKLNLWYKGRVFMYDSSDIENEQVDLLEIIEEAICRKNIRFIIIDNLMTVLDGTTNEKLYREQSNFVGSLCKIAKKYSVVIILVAHPRKRNTEKFTNDDVSGSGDITNKVDVVMSYDRYKTENGEVDDSVRTLWVTKNRLTGKLGNVKLFFDEASKRISDDTLSSKYFSYMNENFEDINNMEIPF